MWAFFGYAPRPDRTGSAENSWGMKAMLTKLKEVCRRLCPVQPFVFLGIFAVVLESLSFTYPPIFSYYTQQAAGLILAGVFLLVNWSRLVRRPTDGGDVRRLWELVFIYGTCLVLLIPVHALSWLDALGALAPRAFVVWFLSMLTLVATTVIARLTQLDKTAVAIEGRAADVKTVVEDAATKFATLNRTAREVSTEFKQVVDAQMSSVGISKQINRIREAGGEAQMGVSSLLKGIAERADATAKAAEMLCSKQATRSIAERVPAEMVPAAGLVIQKVLWLAIANYLGVDPLSPGAEDRGLEYTLEGDYLLYSRLIENLFNGIIVVREDIRNTPYRVEILTTLNVPPRMWYNIIIPVGWKDDLNGWVDEKDPFWDSSPSTSLRWEHYRAVQAACIELGREGNFCGFSRCFLQEGRAGPKESGPLFGQAFEADKTSFIPTCCLTARDRLITAFKARIKPDATLDTLTFQKAEQAELETLMKPLGRADAVRLASRYAKAQPSHIEVGGPGDYIYPVAYEPDYGSGTGAPPGWTRLLGDLVDRYQTSSRRCLLWTIKDTATGDLRVSVRPKVESGKPLLPWDLFAVGVTKADSDINALPGGDGGSGITWLFTVSLITDERGGYTTTRVLTCIDQDERDQADFSAYTGFANLILKWAGDGSRTVRPLLEV